MSFIVAIDGPAGTGKGTATKLIAEEIGLINIDTGALYRCVALESINRGIEIGDTEKIEALVDEININIKNENGNQTIFLNDEDVSDRIRQKDVTSIVSVVSGITGVRLKITDLERKLAEGKDVVMEGRDIGTYVFPNADIKIYLDATPEERAMRRFKQNQEKGIKMSYEEILENINKRDENDKNKEIGALKIADDAVVIDTTKMTIDEVNNKVKEIILEKYKVEPKKEIIKEEKVLSKKEQKEKNKINRRYSYEETKWKLFQRKIVKAIIRGFYKLVYRVEVVGEKIPEDGAYIICGNHVSFFDPPAVVVTQKRHINMMAKEELLKSNLLYWLGWTFNCIPVKRGKQDVESIKRCLAVLKKGELLAIYPEGTRNGLKKNNGKVKNGAAFIVARTGTPVIPVGIIGDFKPFKKVKVNVGKPIDFGSYKTKNPEKEVLEKISTKIMDDIIQLTNEKN